MIRWLEKNRYAAIILTILITIEIFYFSSLSFEPSTTGGIPGIATIYHFVVFFLFNFFLLISIKGDKKIKVYYIIIALIISIAYAFLDEFHQMFVPFREPAIRDILTNTAGIFLSALLHMFIDKKET